MRSFERQSSLGQSPGQGGAHDPGPRIVHVMAGELDSGAGRGAYWLHQALLNRGLHSTMVCSGLGVQGDPTVQRAVVGPGPQLWQRVSAQWAELPVRLYPNRQRRLFSTGLDGYGVAHLPAVREADIVHLHWVNGLMSLGQIRAIRQPVVWTLRDMWPFTGGCHYAMGCENYRAGCGACPQLRSSARTDLSSRVFGNKRQSLPARLTPVGISHWLSDCAVASGVFGAAPVETIPNGIDPDRFKPMPREAARAALGLAQDATVVMFAAQRVAESYKGFQELKQALQRMPAERIHLLIAGRASPGLLTGLPMPCTAMGYVNDDERLCQAYSAADVFVAPSLVEAFGKTLVESLACGTPVVCFDATGPRDIVEHELTGYRARPFDAEDLARGLMWVLGRPADEQVRMRLRCREQALARFDIAAVAERYEALYRRVWPGLAATVARAPA